MERGLDILRAEGSDSTSTGAPSRVSDPASEMQSGHQLAGLPELGWAGKNRERPHVSVPADVADTLSSRGSSL